MNWIEKFARRTSAEANIRSALASIEASRPSGGPKSSSTERYKEALALLYLAVRDLQASDPVKAR